MCWLGVFSQCDGCNTITVSIFERFPYFLCSWNFSPFARLPCMVSKFYLFWDTKVAKVAVHNFGCAHLGEKQKNDNL